MGRGRRTSLMLSALLILSAAPAPARGGEGARWHISYNEAAARAADLRRPLLLEFTGSDWCDWCRSLKTEVFDTPEFAAWSEKTVVLVEVDFPRNRSLDANLLAQNNKLAERFANYLVDGYPTILLLDPTGTRVIGELGYLDGGPAVWTTAADRLLATATSPKATP